MTASFRSVTQTGMSNLDPIFAAFDGNAEELGRSINVPGVTVRQWRFRDSIPPAYWQRIVNAAKARGTTIPLEQFLPPEDASDHAAPPLERVVVCDTCETRVDPGRRCTIPNCPHVAQEAA